MTVLMGKIARYFKWLGGTALYLIFPPFCPVCGEVSGKRHLGEPCTECLARLMDETRTACPKCRRPPAECTCAPELYDEFSVSPMTEIRPLIFSAFYEGYRDGSAVSSLVYHTKRVADSSGAAFLARMISAEILRRAATDGFDARDFVVTYIPRSAPALRKYGFDHMELCAKRCAKLLGCRFQPMLARRGGTDQKALGEADRRRNAEATISLKRNRAGLADGARLIVIDDVITTGATMRAAISSLSLAGAAEIIPASAYLSLTEKSAEA